MEGMESVMQRIASGEIPLLTDETLEVEIASLAEDLLNWEYGHQLVIEEPSL